MDVNRHIYFYRDIRINRKKSGVGVLRIRRRCFKYRDSDRAMKKALFVPVDETHHPVEIQVKSVEIESEHYRIVLPDGSCKLLPRSQVKQLRILDGNTDHRTEETPGS